MIHPLKNTLLITMGFNNEKNIKEKSLHILTELYECFFNYEK